jgi:hypothetical protein
MRATPLVKDWLTDFLIGHASRHAGPWPEPGSAADRRIWSGWLRAMIEIKASPEEAARAGEMIGRGEPVEHHASLAVDIIQGLRRQAQEADATRALAGDRETATAASRHCPHCGGHGLVTLYDRRYDGRRIAELPCVVRGEVVQRPFPMTVMSHCSCPLGRWMRGEVDPDVRARVLDLTAVLSGGTRWVLEDPTRGEDVQLPPGDWRAIAAAMAGDLAERGVAR